MAIRKTHLVLVYRLGILLHFNLALPDTVNDDPWRHLHVLLLDVFAYLQGCCLPSCFLICWFQGWLRNVEQRWLPTRLVLWGRMSYGLWCDVRLALKDELTGVLVHQ